LPKLTPQTLSQLPNYATQSIYSEIKNEIAYLYILRNNISINYVCCSLPLANTHNTSRPCIQNVIEEKLNVTFKTQKYRKSYT